jgi:hypothetical protein
MDDPKALLGLLAAGMAIWAHVPYFLQTIGGTNKPHVFTWIIWTLLTSIAFAAQVTDGAGPGAWATGMTAVICLVITLATLKHGERDIVKSDWVMFLLGLMAIPFWIVTDNPLWSICIVTAIDCSAFYPTFRKSWLRPYDENTFMYGFNIPRHIVTLAALSHISLVTALYPAALLVMNIIMYVMLKMRRMQVA